MIFIYIALAYFFFLGCLTTKRPDSEFFPGIEMVTHIFTIILCFVLPPVGLSIFAAAIIYDMFHGFCLMLYDGVVYTANLLNRPLFTHVPTNQLTALQRHELTLDAIEKAGRV